MAQIADHLLSWPTLVGVLVLYGFAPGALLRLTVLAFHRDDPRRAELLAELRVVPHLKRPVWVAEQIEVALFEGVWERVVWAATGRIIYRWRLGSGVERNRLHPETFWVPNEDETAEVTPGVIVKLMFEMKDGWGERMWVRVTEVKRRHLVGTLDNVPVDIPRLAPDDRVKFKREHIIDIDWFEDSACDGGLTEDTPDPSLDAGSP